MNCSLLPDLIGMRCEPQAMRDGSLCAAVVTPFRFFDGDGMSLFAFSVGDTVHLSDEGMTLSWLLGLGHRLDDRRAWKPLRAALAPYHVTLNDDGVVEVLAPTAQAPSAFARMVSGLLALDAWARSANGTGASTSNTLREEAALYLRAWRPASPLLDDPEPLLGLSGSEHSFAFRMGNEYIDAIGSAPAASSAELRKLVDVRGSELNASVQIRVIVDDRTAPERAATEVSILGRFAKAWPMSRLIRAAAEPSAAVH
ncbi:DUF1828 domain-containing protein [Aquariibacter albus]|uniref:DUF1828 domain-containing protein n=1 Tax=Aquariibacter albus TaxID=2759899 RepID=A0A839HGN7_9BURK|nr:DUF1828 domain-containing protein [Aquariibacter albus]MBB1161487.1 DUF1828 domain-containing protein [Aquariibacter albus]